MVIRDPFAVFVETQNYKLSRFLFLCNARRLNDKPLDAGRQELGVQDFEHVSGRLQLIVPKRGAKRL